MADEHDNKPVDANKIDKVSDEKLEKKAEEKVLNKVGGPDPLQTVEGDGNAHTDQASLRDNPPKQTVDGLEVKTGQGIDHVPTKDQPAYPTNQPAMGVKQPGLTTPLPPNARRVP